MVSSCARSWVVWDGTFVGDSPPFRSDWARAGSPFATSGCEENGLGMGRILSTNGFLEPASFPSCSKSGVSVCSNRGTGTGTVGLGWAVGGSRVGGVRVGNLPATEKLVSSTGVGSVGFTLGTVPPSKPKTREESCSGRFAVRLSEFVASSVSCACAYVGRVTSWVG